MFKVVSAKPAREISGKRCGHGNPFHHDFESVKVLSRSGRAPNERSGKVEQIETKGCEPTNGSARLGAPPILVRAAQKSVKILTELYRRKQKVPGQNSNLLK
ncbi:hypothetical protein GOC54_32725 [Sinorhizobium meliloti]|nr:hypothetical protein [Sinorhizobium meliloti]